MKWIFHKKKLPSDFILTVLYSVSHSKEAVLDDCLRRLAQDAHNNMWPEHSPLLLIAAGSLLGKQWKVGKLLLIFLAAAAQDGISLPEKVSRALIQDLVFRLFVAVATVLHVGPTCFLLSNEHSLNQHSSAFSMLLSQCETHQTYED